jgi:hypothetical protein
MCWTVDNKQPLRPKNEGPGVMVSGVQDEYRGFGFSMTDDEVKTTNVALRRDGEFFLFSPFEMSMLIAPLSSRHFRSFGHEGFSGCCAFRHWERQRWLLECCKDGSSGSAICLCF